MTDNDGGSAKPRTPGRHARSLDERAQIEAAITRLLALPRHDATSWPSVSELARAAGIKRWVLTHKHTDLKDRFQAEIQRLKTAPVSAPGTERTSRRQFLQDEIARLRRENAELHELVIFYAHALNEVGIEYHVLATQRGANSTVLPLPVGSQRVESRQHRRDDITAEPGSNSRANTPEDHLQER